MNETIRVASIGECMIELTNVGNVTEKGFGGDTLNTSLYMSRLARELEIEISYVSALGCDPFSEEMINAWKNEGIDTSLVRRLESKLPGLYAVDTDENGERSFHFWRNDSAAKYWLDDQSVDALIEMLSAFEYIYLSGISLAILSKNSRIKLIDAIRQTRLRGVQVIFDNNFRKQLWGSPEEAQNVYKDILSVTDIALLTFDDEIMIWNDDNEEQCIARTQDFGVREIVIKRGADDCFVVANQTKYVIPTPKIDNIVDTTAAGDSFGAGYLIKRLNGGDCEESALAGHKVAGTVIQYPGAIIPEDKMPKL